MFNAPLRGENEFAKGNSHINGIELFWGYTKIRLVKFKGMNKSMFNLHLKECEFRFNNRKQNIYKILQFRDDTWQKYFISLKHLNLVENRFCAQQRKNAEEMASIQLKRKILEK